MRDVHNNIRAVRTIAAVAAGVTGVGVVGKVVDRQGYDGVEFIISYGTITATNATITPIVKEGDVTGTMTSVADADLLGTEVLAAITATTPRTSGVSKNVAKRIGYTGGKRYVSCSLVPTVTATTPVSVTTVLSRPSVKPTPNP
jgi:hypothetical protein